MSEETEIRSANGADGLIAGLLDIILGLSLSVCHWGQIEPAAFADSMVAATESTITPSTSPEYAAGRRYAPALIAETLRGLALPANYASSRPRAPAWPGFEVVLGGLATGSAVERSAKERDGSDHDNNSGGTDS